MARSSDHVAGFISIVSSDKLTDRCESDIGKFYRLIYHIVLTYTHKHTHTHMSVVLRLLIKIYRL